MAQATKDQKRKVKKVRNFGLILKVSTFWITIALVVLAFVNYGQWMYNKGVFEGISKTQAILQNK